MLAKSVLGAALALCLLGCGKKVHTFEGVEGPAQADVLFQPVNANPSDYDTGQTSRLAIWLTREDSNWLALVSGLKSIGIPFRLTTDHTAALTHDVILVYPYISGRDLPRQSFGAMQNHIREGGTLIGTNVLGGGLQEVFGFESVTEGKDQAFLTIDSGHDETRDFREQGLTALKIGSETNAAANPGTNSYEVTTAAVLARYENGEAAIIKRDYGAGKVFALGVDPGQLLAKGYNRRQQDITDSYANRYRPTIDAFLILIENIYRQNQTGAVTLGTVPDGKDLSVILSHDVDYSQSLVNAIPYAAHQNEVGVQATYFIQTKYVEDYNDKIFMNDEGATYTQQLEALGAEIASHSVSHAVDLWDFPFGDGTETYPDYRPFVQTKDKSQDGTIMGELRVSKFLLENFAQKEEVVSFRPGFLSNPQDMPQALASSGYKYSSSSTANISLTHLPFQLTYGRGFDALTPVFEFPITVEDELPPKMIDRLDDAKLLARQIAKIGGLYVVLTHTDAADSRLDFQKAIVEDVRPYAWMGSLRQFGDWWTARDQVSVDVAVSDDAIEIMLSAPVALSGLTLEMDQCYEVVDAGGLDVSCEDGNYLLGSLSGQQRLVLGPK